MNKTIINFCPTGMVPTKKETPYVPVSPNEIIEQTHRAFEIGITIAHLHARDANRTRLATNAELLQRVHHLMEVHEKTLFTSVELGTLGFYNSQS